MPDLTPQQAEFVLHYTSTPGAVGNASESARRAGYSETSARELGRQLLDKTHVRAAVDEANRQAVSGRLTTKAVALLERVIEDEAAPMKVRVDAAKAVLDRAGWTAGQTGPAQPAEVPVGFQRTPRLLPGEVSVGLVAVLAKLGIAAPAAPVLEGEAVPATLEHEAPHGAPVALGAGPEGRVYLRQD